MENSIPRFKAGNITQGMESVVGDCNGHSCKERMEVETPLFAKAILDQLPNDCYHLLDYGCGIGRLAKEILKQNDRVSIIGVDASDDELRLTKEYVQNSRFIPMNVEALNQKVDFIYCIYVLQHIPAIELRHAIERMHHYSKPGGKLVYCSSDYRMAINSSGSFTDDRHLGVDLRKEVKRLFEDQGPLFPDMANQPQIIKDLVTAQDCPKGSIAHPARVLVRKEFDMIIHNYKPYFGVAAYDSTPQTGVSLPIPEKPINPPKKRLILQNRLAPGDILVMTAAIRSLHIAYPGHFETDVETPCQAIFENNPYITSLQGQGQKIDMHYPLISDHTTRGLKQPGSGISGRHFSDGYRKFLEEILELEIPRSGLVPDLFLSQDEKLWPSPVLSKAGYLGPYWVINAGSKSDFTLKQYHRYQKVVDLLSDHIKFVQIGVKEHIHPPLKDVIDLRGQTNHRELYRTIFHAEGVLTCVSYPMHIAAAFLKPCVVVAGGREGTRWELYPNHRFLHTNGALNCCRYDGCWKSKIEDCVDQVEYNYGIEKNLEKFLVPKCMDMIKPHQIVEAIEMYYEGGILKHQQEEAISV